MTRRKLIAGNWKMNGLRPTLDELGPIARAAAACANVDVAIFPPFTLLAEAAAHVEGVAIGGQDCHPAPSGAHTGCVAAAMLVDAGATHVILGHSERRTDQGETDALVHAKAEAAAAAGLFAIVCVGETERQRQDGEAGHVVAAQLAGSVPAGSTGDALAIGYEPVWAVGTGRTPTAADIEQMHALIRAKLIDILGDEGARVRILYGGSVHGDNAAGIMKVAEVDGVLVGGASLTARQFVPIVEAGHAVS